MKITIITLASFLIFISCSAERLTVKYYLIESSSVKEDSTSENHYNNIPQKNLSSEIRKFTVSKPYDQDRIVLRTKSNEINKSIN